MNRLRGPMATLLVVAAGLFLHAASLHPASSFASQSSSAPPQTNLADLEDEVMCPICGTTLGLSESPQAQREKDFIQRLINEGRTKDQIKDALVAQYGREVLALPDDSGFDLAAWLVPAAALILAAIATAIAVRRWRRAGTTASQQPEPEVNRADDERLNADLARYDP